jgi:predicted AAA+ superfamily ATPase
MKRLIEAELLKWKNTKNKQPLIIDGARQIGKTYSMLEFGKTNYSHVAYFNFEGNKQLQAIFAENLDTQRIVKELSAFSGKTIVKSDTLIIFDEIQACPEAITSLKYFCEDNPEYNLLCAGSLLEVFLNRETKNNSTAIKFSYPVGKVSHLKMYPLNFQEFLWALGFEELSQIILQSFEKMKAMPSTLHNKALELYKIYLLVGGMPAVVWEYLNNNDFDFVKSKQLNILSDYTADMIKYSSKAEALRHEAVFNSIPSQLLKENKKFQYAVIKVGARSKNYEDSVIWLKKAGILLVSYLLDVKNKIQTPLEAYKDNFSFKVAMTDVGLLCSRLSVTPEMLLSDINLSGEVKGAITENYLAQELTSAGNNLYYWESGGIAEVDFVLQLKSDFIPLECKSANNTRSKSLGVFTDKFKPQYSIRVSNKNFGFENGIKSLPLYAAGCIK